jgi:serine/threonine protein kinase
MNDKEKRRILADRLIEWDTLQQQGQDTPAAVLCKDHPELTDTLARQIAALKRVSWIDQTPEDDDDAESAAASDPSPSSKRVLGGRYRLDSRIATGGFAEVYRAYDQELQRVVAIKIPKRSQVDATESFLAEARRVARLKHPSIVPVHDVGIEDGTCYIVTEYVEGGSLADRMMQGQGTVSGSKGLAWIAEIADALEHAHLAGVIHRDIKPANILIDRHGRALLADFGIAQSAMKTGAFAPSLGTLRYMSPEQLEGSPATPASDIYSLAVVMHELIAGKLPYSSDEANVLRREIVSGVATSKVSKDIPASVASVCIRALQHDADKRQATAARLASELRTSSRPTRHKSIALPLLGVVSLAGLLIGSRYLPSPKQPAPHSAPSPASAKVVIPLARPQQVPNATLLNGDFEGKELLAWKFVSWTPAPPDAGLIQDGLGRDGTRGGKIVSLDTNDSSFIQLVAVKPQTKYQIRAWIKTENVGESGGDGANISITGGWEKSPTIKGTQDWTPVWCSFFSAAREKVELHCRLGFYGQGCTGTAYFDDVEMRESSGDPREQQVSLLEQETSLQQHLRALQDQLWMPVRIDEDAMTRLGIDIDQPLMMDGKERNGKALDVVTALLSKADPNGRLTMTLKQYHGIDNVMLITSK